MADFFETKGITKEASIAIILNTFMYADRCKEFTNAPYFESILEQMFSEKDNYEDSQKAAVKIVRDHVKSEPETAEIRRLRFVNFSNNMGSDYTGAYAASFMLTDEKGSITDIYVVFRGTGSGRWYDNGQGLYENASKYQKVALRYFEDTLCALDIDNIGSSVRLVITGHSKGGNLSQFVTFNSKYRDYVNCCISFDGQGFSPEKYASMKADCDFERIREKMYSVCGDNDYVNVLGDKLIPDKNTVYIRTKPAFTDMYSAHSIVPQYYSDIVRHKDDFLYNFTNKCFNNQTPNQRQLAECSKAINANTMKMKREDREKTCNSIMTLAEKFLGGNASPEGLCGEKATTGDFIGFISNIYNEIIPLTAYAGKEIGDDIIFAMMVKTDANNAYLLSATRKERIEYVMHDPNYMNMYYLAVSIAFQSVVNSVSYYSSRLGTIAAPDLQNRIMTAYKAYGLISRFINTVSVEDFFKFIVIIGTSITISGNKVMQLTAFFKQVLMLSTNSTVWRLVGNILDSVADTRGTSARSSKESSMIINQLMNVDLCSYSLSNEQKQAVEEAVAISKAIRILEGTDGDDGIIGEDTDEIIRGYGGDDGLHGNGGNDEIYGGNDDDRIYGGTGNDRLYGEAGDDNVYGKDDDDYIDGGDGSDTLKGGTGNDTVRGGAGDDIICGESGDDTLFGGLGSDRYVFGRGFGNDLINDNFGENIIEFKGISPDELKAEFNENGELMIGMKAEPDSIRIRNFSEGKFGFVFDGACYSLAKQGEELVFARV